ncbi:MAG: YaiO family outer membrane beta-barrel protein [Muricauda sp.]|nr:YaiO family outer membrane beta-barrel protein [Allomuricauda sp.]
MITLILCCTHSTVLQAQVMKQTDTDEILKEALALYRAQSFKESLALTDRGLQLAPDYHDIRVLRIRNLQNLDTLSKALKDLRYLWDKAPNYYDVRELSLRQLRLMGGAVDMALIDTLIETYGHSIEFKLLKAQWLFKAGMVRSSRDLALELVDQKITGSQRYQLNLLLRATVRNEVGFNYQYFNFDDAYNRENWQNFIVEYQHNFKATTAIGRVTHSDRGIDSGELYELDIYPVLSDRLYLFGSIGGSTGSFFPDVKANVSVF